MAAASWILRNATIRNTRFHHRGRHHPIREDDIKLDINEDPRKNLFSILLAICEDQASDLSDGKRLNYLNGFVKIILHINGAIEKYGFAIRDVLLCLRIALLNESTQIRCGGLRAIRHIIRTDDDVIQLNQLLIPFLIARSLDLLLKNNVERIEAMKLVRKILLLSPINFHMAMGRSLIALANSGLEDKDGMLRICLATLCQLGLLNTQLFVTCDGITAILRNLIECQTPKMSEALCGVLLALLDRPETRTLAAIDLFTVSASYSDFNYYRFKDKDRFLDERDVRFNCSRLALLTILRSWPGVLYFCHPMRTCGLKSLISALYVQQMEVRKAILDLFYELLNLPQPEWTDELFVAMRAIDPSSYQSNWRLNDGFVAAEGRTILPHVCRTRPNITELHLTVLLYSFMEGGLLDALVEVICSSDTFISVRTTVLLGELLHRLQFLVPPECCNYSPTLPTLLQYALKNVPQALAAISALQQLHKMLKKRPTAHSLQLNLLMGYDTKLQEREKRRNTSKIGLKSKIQHFIHSDSDAILKETGVLSTRDAYTWNWDLIRIVLRGETIELNPQQDSGHRTFLRNLIEFFVPSHNRFSHMDLVGNQTYMIKTTVGLDLIDCLVRNFSSDAVQLLLGDLFDDIMEQIRAVTTAKSCHDCLFSPQHMDSTQCQSYFLFIGRLIRQLSLYNCPNDFLVKLDIFHSLKHLVSTTNNECYMKLIVSSMDYSCTNDIPYQLLRCVLKSAYETHRLYTTQFLMVLLRCNAENFAKFGGVKMLVDQLGDASKSVHLTALNILLEACENPECLDVLITENPDLNMLSETERRLVHMHFYGTLKGLDLFKPIEEIRIWDTIWNLKYVRLIEGAINDGLTLHQKDSSGKYVLRVTSVPSQSQFSNSTNPSNPNRDVFILPHLYGQLAQHSVGLKLLLAHGQIEQMLQIIRLGIVQNDEDVMRLKAALWAIGHFGSTINGIELLRLNSGLWPLINLAQNSIVYSIRATAFYNLSLVATTKFGADLLTKFGWRCTRHDRHAIWPIVITNDDSDEDDVDEIETVDNTERYHLNSNSTSTDESNPIENDRKPTIWSQHHSRSLSDTTKSNRSLLDGVGLNRRQRNSSMTESTTSGVSSSDSVAGKISIERHQQQQQILSPIPSTCSLITMKPMLRNQKNDNCSLKMNKMSRQDVIGYDILRRLKGTPDSRSDLQNLFLVWDDPKFVVSNLPNEDEDYDRCYMGICLPNILQDLFPIEDDVKEQKPVLSLLDRYLAMTHDSTYDQITEVPSTAPIKWYHDQNNCLKCCWRTEDVFNDEIRAICGEILRLIVHISNPIAVKYVKPTLMRWKQQVPHIFQDFCMYSEVCKAIGEYSYRLHVRRMLHELFLDLDTSQECKNVIESIQKQRTNTTHTSLGSLRLTFSENKFPIVRTNP